MFLLSENEDVHPFDFMWEDFERSHLCLVKGLPVSQDNAVRMGALEKNWHPLAAQGWANSSSFL